MIRMIDYILDTNAILYYLFGESEVVHILGEFFESGKKFAISTITEMELFAYRAISPEEEKQIAEFLASIYRIPVDSLIAQLACSLRKMYRTPPIDALIAATALAMRATLITRNVKDFRKIKGLELLGV